MASQLLIGMAPLTAIHAHARIMNIIMMAIEMGKRNELQMEIQIQMGMGMGMDHLMILVPIPIQQANMINKVVKEDRASYEVRHRDQRHPFIRLEWKIIILAKGGIHDHHTTVMLMLMLMLMRVVMVILDLIAVLDQIPVPIPIPMAILIEEEESMA
jgi:hypothetical protein